MAKKKTAVVNKTKQLKKDVKLILETSLYNGNMFKGYQTIKASQLLPGDELIIGPDFLVVENVIVLTPEIYYHYSKAGNSIKQVLVFAGDRYFFFKKSEIVSVWLIP